MATQTITTASKILSATINNKVEGTATAPDAAMAEKATPPPMDPFGDLISGYPKLAGRMSACPEEAMFRRFGALNARNLLYLQNDLARLEDKLKRVELEDSKSAEGQKRRYHRDSMWLSTSCWEPKKCQPRDGDKKQYDLIIKMRGLLNEYSKTIRPIRSKIADTRLDTALIQQATILREMKEPDAFDLNDIQHFIDCDDMVVINDKGEEASAFVGLDRSYWGDTIDPDSYSRELVVLRPRRERDIFSRIMGPKAIQWLVKCGADKWKKPDVSYGNLTIDESTVFRFTFMVTSLIASLLPVVSIMLLVRMETLNARLGLIAAFNGILSMCLTIFTEAKRTDVFAVTAAYDQPPSLDY
jgi:uncharacterized Tic20 family protein